MSSFHDIVFSLRPKNQKIKSTTYWVAVLKSLVITAVNDYQEEDFLWIKCHGSISVKTINEQYTAKHPEEGEINLRQGSKVPSDTTPMRDLDEFNDHLIVFEPFRGSDPPVRASVERIPLQPIKHQFTVKPDPDELNSKISPSIPKYQVPTPAPQDENSRPALMSSHRPLPASTPYKTEDSEPSYALPPTPRSTAAHLAPTTPVAPIDFIPAAADASSSVAPPNSSQYVTSATPEWAIPQGFEVFADKNQVKCRLRDSSLDASKLRLANSIKGLCSNTM